MNDRQEPFIVDKTPEERQHELELLQIEVNKVYEDAAARGLTNEEFAVEIWGRTVLKEPGCVALAALFLNQVTGFVGEEMHYFIEFLRDKTVGGNLETSGWAVQMIFNGLIIRENKEVQVEDS